MPFLAFKVSQWARSSFICSSLGLGCLNISLQSVVTFDGFSSADDALSAATGGGGEGNHFLNICIPVLGAN